MYFDDEFAKKLENQFGVNDATLEICLQFFLVDCFLDFASGTNMFTICGKIIERFEIEF